MEKKMVQIKQKLPVGLRGLVPVTDCSFTINLPNDRVRTIVSKESIVSKDKMYQIDGLALQAPDGYYIRIASSFSPVADYGQIIYPNQGLASVNVYAFEDPNGNISLSVDLVKSSMEVVTL